MSSEQSCEMRRLTKKRNIRENKSKEFWAQYRVQGSEEMQEGRSGVGLIP